MKKSILVGIFWISILLASAAARTADWYVRDSFDLSMHLTNPQAIEVLPGGFDVVDWEGNVDYIYKLDAQGNLWNETNRTIQSKFNVTNLSGERITALRVYNYTESDQTLIILDGFNKIVNRVNASDFANYTDNLWKAPPDPFSSTDPADVLAGMCTNTTSTWVAIQNRDVINTLAGANGTVNQSGEFSILDTNNIGGLDCIGNATNFYILDEQTSLVFITADDCYNCRRDFLNLSNLTGQPLNSFTDIAVSSSGNFYVTNNASKFIYRITKYVPAVRNIFPANLSFTYPARAQTFNSRFHSREIIINFSAAQGNHSIEISEFTPADQINCTLSVNGTSNSTIFAANNISVNNTFNVSFTPGDYKLEIGCLANISYAQKTKDFKIIYVRTYRHLLWMGDNFSLWYNSGDKQFEAALGNSSTLLQAPYNFTPGDPLAVRVTWDNSSGNRTLYLNGAQEASDISYSWVMEPTDRIYIGSRNKSGQVNGIISSFIISNVAKASKFRKGNFISSWTTEIKNLKELIDKSFFFQFRAVLKRSLTSENPILKFVNVSYDDTLMNFSIEPDIGFLDFSFSSGTSYSVPAGQLTGTPVFTIWNIGNVSFALQAKSLASFDSCFTVMLFNESDQLVPGALNNSMNLSTAAANFTNNLGPNQKASVWINVSATNCGPSSEFFDIEFETSP